MALTSEEVMTTDIKTGTDAWREKDLLKHVREWAKLQGWRDYHSWTSIHSPRGFPDLFMVRIKDDGEGEVIAAELKSNLKTSKASPAQMAWLEDLSHVPGIRTFLWRPSDWDAIVETLR